MENFQDLFYREPQKYEGEAEVLWSCPDESNPGVGSCRCRLQGNLFYPEGGGQPADQGWIQLANLGQRFRVYHVQRGEAGVELSVEGLCVEDLRPGMRVWQQVDSEKRLRWAQLHSAEHLLCGLAAQKWGCQNVGFHMTEDSFVMDLDQVLGEEQLEELFASANHQICANLPLHAEVYSAEELRRGEVAPFRSKGTKYEWMRVVEIEGQDRCACCGLHVQRTGDLGALICLSAEKHRGGMRITATCGVEAWRHAWEDSCLLRRAGALLSTPRLGIPEKIEEQKFQLRQVQQALSEREQAYWQLQEEWALQCFGAEPNKFVSRSLCIQDQKAEFRGSLDGKELLHAQHSISFRPNDPVLQEFWKDHTDQTGAYLLLFALGSETSEETDRGGTGGQKLHSWRYWLYDPREGNFGTLLQQRWKQDFSARGGGKGTCFQGSLQLKDTEHLRLLEQFHDCAD